MYGYIAQLEEHRAFNSMAAGSNPAVPTTLPSGFFAMKFVVFCKSEFAQRILSRIH